MNAEKLLDEMVDAVVRVIAVHNEPYIVDKSPIKKALAPYVLEFCETGDALGKALELIGALRGTGHRIRKVDDD